MPITNNNIPQVPEIYEVQECQAREIIFTPTTTNSVTSSGIQTPIPQLLTQFKLRRLVPSNFLELKIEEGNYICSTNSKWKNKPLCERYIFYLDEEEEVILDIPHQLLDEWKVVKGKDIELLQFFIDPKVLEKRPTYGAITVENETEIILINPFNHLVIKERGIQTEEDQDMVKLYEEIRQKEDEIRTHLVIRSELENNIVNLTRERDNLSQRPTRGELQEKQDRLLWLENKMNDLTVEKDDIRQQLKRIWIKYLLYNRNSKKENSDLKSCLCFLRRILSDKDKEIDNLRDDLGISKKKNDELSKKYNSLEQEKRDLERRYVNLEEEKEYLERSSSPNSYYCYD